jgi:hypothetical protein
MLSATEVMPLIALLAGTPFKPSPPGVACTGDWGEGGGSSLERGTPGTTQMALMRTPVAAR